jgi:hypothetical protein
MANYNLSSEKTWLETKTDLEATFRLWGVNDFVVIGKPPRQLYDWQSPADGRVTVRFMHPSGHEIVAALDTQQNARLNLRAIYLALEDMRLVEKRGLAAIMGSVFLQLNAGTAAHLVGTGIDAYTALGAAPAEPLGVIEARYRALIAAAHPDRADNAEERLRRTERTKLLNDAIAQIRKERAP